MGEMADGNEVDTHETNPNDADTDGDGLSDGDEVDVTETDPLDSTRMTTASTMATRMS